MFLTFVFLNYIAQGQVSVGYDCACARYASCEHETWIPCYDCALEHCEVEESQVEEATMAHLDPDCNEGCIGARHVRLLRGIGHLLIENNICEERCGTSCRLGCGNSPFLKSWDRPRDPSREYVLSMLQNSIDSFSFPKYSHDDVMRTTTSRAGCRYDVHNYVVTTYVEDGDIVARERLRHVRNHGYWLEYAEIGNEVGTNLPYETQTVHDKMQQCYTIMDNAIPPVTTTKEPTDFPTHPPDSDFDGTPDPYNVGEFIVDFEDVYGGYDWEIVFYEVDDTCFLRKCLTIDKFCFEFSYYNNQDRCTVSVDIQDLNIGASYTPSGTCDLAECSEIECHYVPDKPDGACCVIEDDCDRFHVVEIILDEPEIMPAFEVFPDNPDIETDVALTLNPLIPDISILLPETESPTESPTDSPTQKPISSSPTVNPSPQPTDVPTYRPTYEDCLTLSRTEEQLTCLKNKIEVLSQRCDANQEYQNSCESMRDDIRSILRN